MKLRKEIPLSFFEKPRKVILNDEKIIPIKWSNEVLNGNKKVIGIMLNNK